jgi:hypothetical protein
MMIQSTAFEVRRDAFGTTRITAEALDAEALSAAGQAVLAIDQFALTANNITYAAYGDSMKYWDFFPANDGYGRIPVWGFADVVASPSPDLPVGTRLYGYFPMASHLVVTPAKINAARVIDASPHRRALPAVYNAYERVAASASANVEAKQMILKPLVITSFLIADFLDDNAMFGATQVIVSSASSKTSLGLGSCLKRLKRPGLTSIGLTSPGNRAFVDSVGAFDTSCTYDGIAALDPAVRTVFVDMAGSTEIIKKVHGHFRDALVYSCRVGATHWEDASGRVDVPGAKPVFFFAPSQVQKRMADWGPGGLEQRFGAAWAEIAGGASWLAIDAQRGVAAIEAAYRATLAGKVPPSAGIILSF